MNSFSRSWPAVIDVQDLGLCMEVNCCLLPAKAVPGVAQENKSWR